MTCLILCTAYLLLIVSSFVAGVNFDHFILNWGNCFEIGKNRFQVFFIHFAKHGPWHDGIKVARIKSGV